MLDRSNLKRYINMMEKELTNAKVALANLNGSRSDSPRRS